MTAPHTPGLGTLLGGRYRLEQRVGRGGMADVFRARDELLHRVVAVKLFRPDTSEEQDRQRFDAEMRTVAGLRHPGLVTLYDAGAGDATTDGAPFLVMEFVEGRTLRERLSDGPLAAADAARIGTELAAALAYVHGLGIVHRDVKPANILLDTTDGVTSARLTDFGIAQLGDGGQLTAHGTTVGTANYLSPEQALGRPLGPASDVYSLGLVLLEARTGRLAYPGSGVDAAIARLHRRPDLPHGLGAGWVALLDAMTADDPQQRPSAGQARQALDDLVRGKDVGAGALAGAPTTAFAAVPAGSTQVLPAVPGGAPPVGPPTQLLAQEPERRRRRALPLVIAAIVAVLAVVAGIVLATSGGGGAGGVAPSSSPVAGYPAVGGTLGSDLRALESQVDATAASNTRLRADTLALARALAANPRADVTSLLQALDADAAAGTLTSAQQASLQSALSRVRADLAAGSTSGTGSASGTGVAPSTAASSSAAGTAPSSRTPSSTAASTTVDPSVAATRSSTAASTPGGPAAGPGGNTPGAGPGGNGPPGQAKKTDPGKPGKP